ncbi:MAG: hypothetical protein ABFS09_12570 [Thermodesulfobacteriota bacterium]
MEAIIEELKKIVSFKSTTDVGDVVLVVAAEPNSMIYALVTDFERDESKRDEWWHVSLQILSVPPQKVTWTLRASQFTGQEIFTMGGEKRFVAAVDFDGKAIVPPPPKGKESKPSLRLVK